MAAKKLYEEEKKASAGEAKLVALWQERVQIAKKAQKDWSDQSGAERFEKEYKGDYGIVFQSRNKSIKVPPINEVFSYVQADIATTYNRDPYITVNPEAGTEKGAALWEVILNYWWRKLEIKEEIEYEIIDKDIVGHAWHKTGYDAGSGKPYSRWMAWRDVLWNLNSKRPPLDCQWMAYKFIMPLDEMRSLFPVAKGIEGSQSPDVDDDSYKKASNKDDIKVGVGWEIWDLKSRQIFLIAEGLKDRFLEKPRPWPECQTRFPSRMYWDFAVPGQARPMSAIAPWESQILEEMVLMAQAVNHAKRWNRQLFIKGGSVDENSLDKFERGDDGAVITVNGTMDESSFRFADFGPLSADFYLLMDRLQAIKRNINGQPEFVRGGVTKTGTRTVGELQEMKAGFTGRQERKIDRLETHCENIARDLMACLKANFDFEETIKITGELPEKVAEALGDNFDPETGIVSFTPEEIQGEYDVDVKSGSTLPLDKQTRVRVLEIILQTLGGALAQGPLTPTMQVLISELLKDYDIKSIDEAFKTELAMIEKSKAENQGEKDAQTQKVEAEAAKRVAQADKISVETEIAAQEAAMGPIGRADLERMKKPQPSLVGGPR